MSVVMFIYTQAELLSPSVIPDSLQGQSWCPNCGRVEQPGPRLSAEQRASCRSPLILDEIVSYFWSQLLTFQGPLILPDEVRRLSQRFVPV